MLLLLQAAMGTSTGGGSPPPVVYLRPIGLEERRHARPEGDLRNGGHRTPVRIVPSSS